MEQKVFWKSKTIWVAFFSLVYAILQFQGIIDLKPELVASISGIVFMVLRFMTGVSIGLEDVKPDAPNN